MNRAAYVVLILFLAGCNKNKEWGVATFLDGGELIKLCGAEDQRAQMACTYYILGVVDSRNSTFAEENKKDWLCGDPMRKNVVDAVIGELRAHPNVTEQASAKIIHDAVDTAYGCTPKRPK